MITKTFKIKIAAETEEEMQKASDYLAMTYGAEEDEIETGRWVHDPSDIEQDWWECSNCGRAIFSITEDDRLEFHRFCGRCGAKMEV